MESPLADTESWLDGLPRRISDIPASGAERAPHDDALREENRTWSYADLENATADVARNLAAAGVRPGDRVLVVGENCAALVALLFGIARVDGWSVLVNARLSAREVDAIRDHCEPRRVIYLTNVSPDARIHANRHGAGEAMSIPAMADVRIGPLNSDCAPEIVADDPAVQVAVLLYTTGTTGNPKGVMLTHRNVLFIARVSSTLRRLGPGDRVYGVLPISHVYGLASVCLGTLFAGACLSLEARYSPQAMTRALATSGITVAQGVPAMYVKLLDHLRAGGQPVVAPRLRFIYAGGSPLDPTLKADVERQFGLTLHNGYGLTEASPTVTQTRLEAPRTDCSVGTVLPGVETRIVDAQGHDVPAGAPGELWVRGPNVMRGYFRNAGLTAQAIDADGWLNTGDMARQEADGALFIVGRTKELIIRSGFNVHPAEVEGVLNAHPAVIHSAVVGRPVTGNEEVVAFVELVPGGATSVDELARFAAQHLAPYKRPAEIVILPLLPVSATGKILKHQLRMQAQSARRDQRAARRESIRPDKKAKRRTAS